MLSCSSNELCTQTDQLISRFRRDEHTAKCWSHVDVVVVTVHVLHVLATPVTVTRYCELCVETRDVSLFVPRSILQLGREATFRTHQLSSPWEWRFLALGSMQRGEGGGGVRCQMHARRNNVQSPGPNSTCKIQVEKSRIFPRPP